MTFDNRKEYGEVAERAVVQLLKESYDWVYHYDDYDGNPAHREIQHRGIDIKAATFGSKNVREEFFYLDVKRNVTPEGKFFLEVHKDGYPGWFVKSSADIIVHANLETPEFIWYELAKIRQRVICERILPSGRGLIATSATDGRFDDLMHTRPIDYSRN